MKKIIKCYKRQILAFALVCLIALATCLSVSALNSSHVDFLTIGDVSILSNSSFNVTETFFDSTYSLTVQPIPNETLTGEMQCTLSDFYIDSSLSDSGVNVYFNTGLGIGDTFITIHYSEDVDTEILTLTREIYSPEASDINIPYSDFELDSFYIHSFTITSTTTDYVFSFFKIEFDGVIESNEFTTVLDAVLDVFFNVGTWISTSVHNLISMFFVDGSLTFLGVLAVAGLAISVIFLILSVIVNFLRFGG